MVVDVYYSVCDIIGLNRILKGWKAGCGVHESGICIGRFAATDCLFCIDSGIVRGALRPINQFYYGKISLIGFAVVLLHSLLKHLFKQKTKDYVKSNRSRCR